MNQSISVENVQSLEHALRDLLDLGTRQSLPVGLSQEVAIKVL
jgi:hypothetical protein